MDQFLCQCHCLGDVINVHTKDRECVENMSPETSWASELDQQDSMSLPLAERSLTRKIKRMTSLPKIKDLSEMSWAFYGEDKIEIFELFFHTEQISPTVQLQLVRGNPCPQYPPWRLQS